MWAWGLVATQIRKGSIPFFPSKGFLMGDIIEIECTSCGKPMSEHTDEWGRHQTCIEQIIDTMTYNEREFI